MPGKNFVSVILHIHPGNTFHLFRKKEAIECLKVICLFSMLIVDVSTHID